MPGLTLILQHLGLALRLAATHPQLDVVDVIAHARAAEAAATPQLSPELLLGMAYVESRFDPLAVSRIEGQRRRVGHYESNEPPPRWLKGSSLYCGPLQTFAGSWSECIAMRDPHVAYAAGADELEHWLRDKRVRGDITRALAGYGCGYHGVKTGKCNRYPGRVLWQARRLASNRPVPGRA